MKLGTFVVMLITLIVFLEIVGVETGLGNVLDKFGITLNGDSSNADLESSTFWGWIFAASGVLAVVSGGGAVIIGFFAKSYDTSLIILPFIISFAGILISVCVNVVIFVNTYHQDWLSNLIVTIFVALGVAFVFSCLDYFSGR